MVQRKTLCMLVVCMSLLLQAALVQADDIPYVNPLGDVEHYWSVSFIPVSDLYDPWIFGYLADEDYQYVELWGNIWHLEVPGESLADLLDYLEALNGTVFSFTEEELLAQIGGPQGDWWIQAAYWGEDYYELTVIEELGPPDLASADEYDDEYFPLPLINPLQDRDSYYLAEYEPPDLFEIPYFNSLGEQVYLRGQGETWFFYAPTDDVADPLQTLEEHILELGATMTERSPHMLCATLIDSESNLWQTVAQYEPGEDQYMLRVTKEQVVRAHQTLTIHPQPDQEWVSVATFSDGLNHKSLIVELSNGTVEIQPSLTSNYGEYTRNWDAWIPLYHERTPIYVLDYIPQEPGKTIWWMRFEEESRPEEIRVTLKESVPLPSLSMGSQLGVLRVIGATIDDLEVEPSLGMTFAHPDFESPLANQTPEGDHIFYLPAGYWDVIQRSVGFPTVRARMIPVSSGEVTVFVLPEEMKSIYEEPAESVITNAYEMTGHAIAGDLGTLDFVLTPASDDVIPTLERSQIREAGLLGEILSIEPITTPPNIVLLLDSSGSMRAQMEQTLVTAREFISSLTDGTSIQVIDFDTTPKLLAGTSKEEVLASLAEVKADGATCLYDSILKGLSLLENKERPILLVFTDGVDANWDDTGPGSKATLPEVVAAVEKEQIPLYTIGFGPGHDKTVLEQLAKVSTGKYFWAADQDALNQVFQGINSSLANTFHLVYQRPKKPIISNVPVVCIMVDTSGSMDTSPEEADGCNYRMQKVKNVLHDFILGLPEQTLVQIGSFSWYSHIEQSLTLDKASALHAIGGFEAAGATDTLGSIALSLGTLNATPSTNKTLIYITDAAIEERDESIDKLLQELHDSDIKTIWMGLGMENEDDVFVAVAEKTGGRYVVTEDHLVLAAVLDEVLQEVRTATTDPDSVEVQLTTAVTTPEGKSIHYMGSMNVPYTKLASSNETIGPQLYSYYGAGTPASVWEMQAFGLLSSESQQPTGNIKKDFIPLEARGANKAVNMQITGATVTNVLAGLEAPPYQQFLSIDFVLENILEPQEVEVDAKGNSHPANWLGSAGTKGRTEFKVPDYLIPSLPSHLYLGWNNSSMHPVSKASWIDPNSLLIPGDSSLTVRPGETRTGTLVFLVDEQSVSQLSLHFYDTAYGHFKIDLIGASSFLEFELENLPTTEPARLSDVFELQVRSVSDVTEIGQYAANEGNVFRIVEVDLTSRVQALLDIDPKEVFSLKVMADQGVFYLPVHPLTREVPFGFSEAAMVAPGSYNKLRFVFELPQALATNGCDLFIDLRTDDLLIPLIDSPAPRQELTGTPLRAEGIELYVNQLGRLRELGDDSVDYVVADLTFVDHFDDFGTELIDAFKLIRDDYAGVSSEVDMKKLVTQGGLGDFTSSGEVLYELQPGIKNTQFVLEFEDGVVKDGLTRRALLFFELPQDGLDHTWSLRSDVFPELNQTVPETDYEQVELLGKLTTPPFDFWAEDFALRLQVAIANAIREYQAVQAARGALHEPDRMDLAGTNDQEITIAPPATTASGLTALEQITSVDQLLQLLQTIRWLPRTDQLYQARYAPEAVLTQMWGTEADLTSLAEVVLQRLGYNPERSVVDLTEAGVNALAERAGIPDSSIQARQLPALKYQLGAETKLLVLPFGSDFSELTEYVDVPWRREQTDGEPLEARITVSFEVVSIASSIGSQFGDLASVLGGSTEEEELLHHFLLEVSLPITELSKDPIDLLYVSAGENLYTAVLETPQGRFTGEDPLDTTEYEIRRTTVDIWFDDRTYTHSFDLAEGQSITEVAHTIAINSPDLPKERAKELQEIATILHQTTDQPDSFSVFQWHTRNIINRFLVAQTEAEQTLARNMDLVIGRTKEPRVIVVTVAGDCTDNTINTSINLVHVAPQIHTGEEEIRRAFNIGTGLMASSIEAQALGDGLGVFELWSYLPPDTPMLWIESNGDRSTALEILRDAGFSELVQHRISEANDKVIVIPMDRLLIGGKPRTAWLEIDPSTYFTIGVIDTGEHGAMIESAVQNLLKQFTKHSVGALLGIHSMLWGVSTFALEFGEYDEILLAALENSLAMVEKVKQAFEELAKYDPRQIKGIMEKIEQKGVSAINDLGQLAKDEVIERIKAKAEAIPKDKVKELLPSLSFVEGMIDGIELFVVYASP